MLHYGENRNGRELAPYVPIFEIVVSYECWPGLSYKHRVCTGKEFLMI